MGEVLNEALQSWLQEVANTSTHTLPDDIEEEAVRNNRVYRKHRARLLARHRGRYVAVARARILGVYGSATEAAQAVRRAGGRHGVVTRLEEKVPRQVDLGWSLVELAARS